MNYPNGNYDMAGLTLSTAKSELIGFGFDPNPITVNGTTILPSNSIKFLGIHIESNLKWNKHVELLCNKLRSTAGRIRSEGRLFSINDRRTLYFAWSQGSLMSNALSFLPRLNYNQMKNIQTAANSAVRAILGLPQVGHFPISHLREQLKIPSVTDVRDHLCRDFHICRKRHFFKIEIITFLESPNYALYFILINVF